MRVACSAISSANSGEFQRCQTSNVMPTFGTSASSRRSTASPIVLAIVHSPPPSRWYSRPRRARVAPDRRAREKDDARRLEARKPRNARAERVDPSLRFLRTAEQGQREDRRHGGDRVRRAKAAGAQALGRRAVVTLGELDLPDPDPVDARGGAVRVEIVVERGRERAHLRDRKQRHE
jgi:hypothetical protein